MISTRVRPETPLFRRFQAREALVAAGSSHPAPSHPGGACPPDAEDAQEQSLESLIAAGVAEHMLLNPEAKLVSIWVPLSEDRFISRVVRCQ